MAQNYGEAYYRLAINTINGGAEINNFRDTSDDDALLYAMISYVSSPHRSGYSLFKYDQNDTCGTYQPMGKYEESTAIG